MKLVPRVLFVGQAPSRSGEGPLGPLTGRGFVRLCRWWGVSMAWYAGRVERMNLNEAYSGKVGRGDAFDDGEAMRTIAGMHRLLANHDLVVLWGKKVARAASRVLGLPRFSRWGDERERWNPNTGRPITFVLQPHPSGSSSVLNNPRRRLALRRWLRERIGVPGRRYTAERPYAMCLSTSAAAARLEPRRDRKADSIGPPRRRRKIVQAAEIGRVPPSAFRRCEDYSYVTEDLVRTHHSDREAERFLKWMGGQTCGLGPGNEIRFYSWDYLRWLQTGKPASQVDAAWD